MIGIFFSIPGTISVITRIDAKVKEVKDSENGKWKQKSIEQILGIPKTKKKDEKKIQSYVLFRSTVIAAAVPIFCKGISKTHLDEAQAIWVVNKIMGLRCMGDEKDVIRRIAIMEGEDEESARG
ncbi:hypothetical protein RHMOL_Rhmol06G0085500 [Rhododendron molle]|uniref:Uncharacterized protein n=1 Tax=Rhododendron molle TaxID=49168 RepID=A0ACC0NBD9_RHOML|nr:hypothetical protein RHMOL_Rhmol06G0085500 [Rhododendron molle]